MNFSHFILLVSVFLTGGSSFSTTSLSRLSHHGFFAKPSHAIATDSTIALQQSFKNDDMDGTTRGIPILAASLLVCAWSFSIPPEFRRSHICMTDRCVPTENRKYCHDCKTVSELKEGITKYYASGGGVHFDFSIEEK
jgi:hypothetical protein